MKTLPIDSVIEAVVKQQQDIATELLRLERLKSEGVEVIEVV